MINIEVLERLIDQYEVLIEKAAFFGYVNLRFFCSYYEEDKHILNIIADFDSTKCKEQSFTQDINQELKGLLNNEVTVWGVGSAGLRKTDCAEAEKAPLLDMIKTIDYFIDVIIPFSTDVEPIEEERVKALKRWQEHQISVQMTQETSILSPTNIPGDDEAVRLKEETQQVLQRLLHSQSKQKQVSSSIWSSPKISGKRKITTLLEAMVDTLYDYVQREEQLEGEWFVTVLDTQKERLSKKRRIEETPK